ncbi:hypothetical protein HS088_TW11G00238 [Tripterygium wilfordii]|uniref:Protein kinase domain-containing protein n=1 Tax=Tripterygium wilfordii TaxID=458696 RepID=A0A7J7D1D8_TRIWF|nr:serine/threonine-protein kinase-like protein At1g28390 [Tripterygium wilfordii]KAF5740172.1 hypothetical protein HS088_TW11G00238 [Tripterygium wilfordii]
MGYLSCNAESAISTCDSHNWNFSTKSKSRRKSCEPVKIREFSYNELVTATNDFSAENFLGKGSHGSVYRAVLDGGKLIAAVKKTVSAANFQNSSNSSNSPADNEIEILSRVRNPCLVNLIGFCSEIKDKKLIVVEYMPNGSLYDLLHSSSTPPAWSRRVLFALQLAKAIQFLHSSNPPVIHRDIKSSNVLIDRHWNTRLGDFGLALRGHVEDVLVKCTPPAGTLGYLDPGYLAPGDLSTKSDVFSFGILLLEIISGRNAIDFNYSPPSVVDWAVPLIKQGNFTGILDERIRSPADPAVVRKLAVLAARCVRSTADKRPNMAEVVEYLKVINKRARAPPIWNHCRRHGGTIPPAVAFDAVDRSEEVVKVARLGSRRTGKVSNVSSVEYIGNEATTFASDRVTRSKSTGSFKPGSDSSSQKRRTGVTVISRVRLNKSRSTGLLQGPRVRVVNSNHKSFEPRRIENSTETDMSTSMKRMQEKPLFSN